MSLDRNQFIKEGQAWIDNFRAGQAKEIKAALETLWNTQGEEVTIEIGRARRTLNSDDIAHLDLAQAVLSNELARPTQTTTEKKIIPKENAHHVAVDIDGLFTYLLQDRNSRLRKLRDAKNFLDGSLPNHAFEPERIPEENPIQFLIDLVKKEMAREMMKSCRAMFHHMIADAKQRNADLIIHIGSARQSKLMDNHLAHKSLSLTEILPFVPEAIASIDPEMNVVMENNMLADSFGNRKSGHTYEKIRKSKMFQPAVEPALNDAKQADFSDAIDEDEDDDVLTDDTKVTQIIHQINLAREKYPRYKNHSYALYDDRGYDILTAASGYLKKNHHLSSMECSFYEFPTIQFKNGDRFESLTRFMKANEDYNFANFSKPEYEFPVVRMIDRVQGTGEFDPHYQENCILRAANFKGLKLEGDVRHAMKMKSPGQMRPIPVDCDLMQPEINPYKGKLQLTHAVKEQSNDATEAKTEGAESESPAVEPENPTIAVLRGYNEIGRKDYLNPHLPNSFLWPRLFAQEEKQPGLLQPTGKLDLPSIFPGLPTLPSLGSSEQNVGASQSGFSMMFPPSLTPVLPEQQEEPLSTMFYPPMPIVLPEDDSQSGPSIPGMGLKKSRN
jgi:hypothetical protein